MKKVLLFILVLISINTFSQCAGTNNLTMEVRHWYWAVNKYGAGTDSASIGRIRDLRTQLIATNPADSTTSVQITGIPNDIILGIYSFYGQATFAEYMNMGSTDAERRTIFTNIRALVTPCIVSRIAEIDYNKSLNYWNGNKTGKAILKNTQ